MRERYFVYHKEKNFGPYTFAEIEAKLNRSELFPTDHVYISDQGEWKPMLEFILVYGPKMKVVHHTLQTEGSSDPNDTKMDLKRFASGLPAPAWVQPTWNVPAVTDPQEPAYPPLPEEARTLVVHPTPNPEPQFPPPPAPPRAVIQRRILEQTQRTRSVKDAEPLDFQTTVQPLARIALPQSVAPVATVAAKQAPKPLAVKTPYRTPARAVDASAVAEVKVLPAMATRLQIHINGEARVGDDLEVIVQALSENGTLDLSFNENVQLACNQPLQGLETLRFANGEARIKVRCLTHGTHLFHLTLQNETKQLGDGGRGKVLSH